MSFHPLVNLTVQHGAVKGLMAAKPELGWLAARREVKNADDDMIAHCLTAQGLTPPPEVVAALADGTVGAIGDGTIIKWIQDHWEQIMAAIKMLVSLLLLFV